MSKFKTLLKLWITFQIISASGCSSTHFEGKLT